MLPQFGLDTVGNTPRAFNVQAPLPCNAFKFGNFAFSNAAVDNPSIPITITRCPNSAAHNSIKLKKRIPPCYLAKVTAP